MSCIPAAPFTNITDKTRHLDRTSKTGPENVIKIRMFNIKLQKTRIKAPQHAFDLGLSALFENRLVNKRASV